MNLKDYLHLYFGCEAVDHEGWKTTVEWSDLGYPDQIDKLILRPLSEMADDEALRLAKLYSGDTDPKRVKGTASNWWYFKCFHDDQHILVIGATGEAWYQHYFDHTMTGHRNVVNCHDATLFLLSCGFDLFGLIDAGLAIDATTLKTEKA